MSVSSSCVRYVSKLCSRVCIKAPTLHILQDRSCCYHTNSKDRVTRPYPADWGHTPTTLTRAERWSNLQGQLRRWFPPSLYAPFPSLLFFCVHFHTCSNESNRPPLRYDYARHQDATQSYSLNTTTPDDDASAVSKLNFSSCHHRRLCYRRCSAHQHPHCPLRNRPSRVISPLIW